MEVVVYLPDNSGYQFQIEGGKTANATKFFDKMVDALNIPPPLARKCFALWLKSPLLDVQLKPQHVPFRMVRQWGTLIARFSRADDAVKSKDEPALMFKRNAFLSKEEEMKIQDPRIFDILMMEARFNIQRGIFPCDREDIEQLGVLLCVMNKEQINEDENKQEIVKHTIQEVVPPHMNRHKKSFLRRQKSIEEKVYHSYEKCVSKDEVENAQIEFMKICWQLPYYGSVVFEGEVNNSNNNSLTMWFLQGAIMQVNVAINTSGIWVIDRDKKHVLVGLKYGEFNWEVATPPIEEDEEKIPSLFIEFDEQETPKLLQILSKQANMMSSMIETCNTMSRQAEHRRLFSSKAASDEGNSTEQPDKDQKTKSMVSSQRVRPLFNRQNSVTANRTGKLCLTPITEKAEKTDSPTTSSSCDPHKPPTSPTPHHTSKRQSLKLFKRLSFKNKTEGTKEERNELL